MAWGAGVLGSPEGKCRLNFPTAVQVQRTQLPLLWNCYVMNHPGEAQDVEQVGDLGQPPKPIMLSGIEWQVGRLISVPLPCSAPLPSLYIPVTQICTSLQYCIVKKKPSGTQR